MTEDAPRNDRGLDGKVALGSGRCSGIGGASALTQVRTTGGLVLGVGCASPVTQPRSPRLREGSSAPGAGWCAGERGRPPAWRFAHGLICP